MFLSLHFNASYDEKLTKPIAYILYPLQFANGEELDRYQIHKKTCDPTHR